MKTMFDTSVLVPALLSKHPNHNKAAALLRRAQRGEFHWFLAAHTLAECYATLTAKTGTLALAPSLVAESIRVDLVEHHPTIVELSAADYVNSIKSVASLGLSSGVIYDALIIAAAQKVGIERFYTFNLKHFLQVWPQGSAIITSP
jgi:predicted nucleic acid-binding protein